MSWRTNTDIIRNSRLPLVPFSIKQFPLLARSLHVLSCELQAKGWTTQEWEWPLQHNYLIQGTWVCRRALTSWAFNHRPWLPPSQWTGGYSLGSDSRVIGCAENSWLTIHSVVPYSEIGDPWGRLRVEYKKDPTRRGILLGKPHIFPHIDPVFC